MNKELRAKVESLVADFLDQLTDIQLKTEDMDFFNICEDIRESLAQITERGNGDKANKTLRRLPEKETAGGVSQKQRKQGRASGQVPCVCGVERQASQSKEGAPSGA